MTNTRIKFKKLRPNAILPQYMTFGSAGMDLSSGVDNIISIRPGERVGVPTGLAMELPSGWEAQIRPRSGLALRCGVTVLNAPGTVDNDYRGEIIVLLVNFGITVATIFPKDRIAQMVVAPIVQAEIEEVDNLSETIRGSGGFGSTSNNEASKH